MYSLIYGRHNIHVWIILNSIDDVLKTWKWGSYNIIYNASSRYNLRMAHTRIQNHIQPGINCHPLSILLQYGLLYLCCWRPNRMKKKLNNVQSCLASSQLAEIYINITFNHVLIFLWCGISRKPNGLSLSLSLSHSFCYSSQPQQFLLLLFFLSFKWALDRINWNWARNTYTFMSKTLTINYNIISRNVGLEQILSMWCWSRKCFFRIAYQQTANK